MSKQTPFESARTDPPRSHQPNKDHPHNIRTSNLYAIVKKERSVVQLLYAYLYTRIQRGTLVFQKSALEQFLIGLPDYVIAQAFEAVERKGYAVRKTLVRTALRMDVQYSVRQRT